ncbi:MAG: NADH-quinone oxidoreductase subunit L [Pseudomonadota bacterium]
MLVEIMNFINISYLIPLIPLLGAAANGFVAFSGIRASRRFVYLVGCISVLASLILSFGCLHDLWVLDPAARSVSVTWFEWVRINSVGVNAGFLIDQLSVVMMLVVTGVGFLIHLYSTGYMNADPDYARFFSYLNLFTFAMLMLVMADNLLLMFVGWEGVGLCSYLLIAFWYEHKPNAVAGMKAFVVNRIGDFGFLLGILVLFWGMYAVGHPAFAFVDLKANAGLLQGAMAGPIPLVTLVCLLLFFGATGKSAQIPLYVWLPDAMAGPTPVSALIHAATMVTAGVYMIGRMSFLYAMSPAALAVVAAVGAATALFAATIGFAQDDIKKVLAYSTVSQLGYMFLGMGTGMYASGIFHLVTHAFFKACLFLGAGCVILGMHHEQNIKRMGGFRKFMPVTFVSFVAATLALSGIFPLSGFFSKDEILWQAFLRGGHAKLYYGLWTVGLASAFATAFYMFRCVSLVFLGKLRREHDYEQHERDALEDKRRVDQHFQPFTPVEHSKIMTWVVAALAVLSVLGGVLGVPAAIGKYIHIPNLIADWLGPVFPAAASEGETAHPASLEYLLMIVSVMVAVAGIAISTWLYTKKLNLVEAFTKSFRRLYVLVLNKYYVDEIYDAIFVRPLIAFNAALKWFDDAVVDGAVNLAGAFGVLSARVSGWWDDLFVDGAVNCVAGATIAAGKRLRTIQTGRIQHYFYIALAGLLAVFIWRLAI